MSSPKELSVPPRQLYFAFGSNLWLRQMALRCPNSHYVGRAILPDYRWQINQRGYANIVPACGFSVHGLAYELGAGDEPRLDRSEGVSSGAYSKAYHSVVLHSAPAALRMPTQSLVENNGLKLALYTAQMQRSMRKWDVSLWPGVLVYVSYDYVTWGSPQDEYIDRINFGIEDSVCLGIPGDFFENSVRSLIPERPAEHHVNSWRSLRSSLLEIIIHQRIQTHLATSIHRHARPMPVALSASLYHGSHRLTVLNPEFPNSPIVYTCRY